MRFVLLDATNGATTRDGGQLSPGLLAHFAEAYTRQLNTDYSAEYGGNFSVRAGANATDLQEGEAPFLFLPSFAEAANAVAYHSTNGNGQPLLFDAISASDSLNGSGNTVSVAGSHELLETAANAVTNRWRDVNQLGDEIAEEVGDPFENQSYPISCSDGIIVWVSNFALPAWFAPGRPGPYNHMSSVGLQVTDAPGPCVVPAGQGYAIRRRYDPSSEYSVNGRTVDVLGEMRRRPEVHHGSRKHRLGVRT